MSAFYRSYNCLVAPRDTIFSVDVIVTHESGWIRGHHLNTIIRYYSVDKLDILQIVYKNIKESIDTFEHVKIYCIAGSVLSSLSIEGNATSALKD